MNTEQQYALSQQYLIQVKAGLETLNRYQVLKIEAEAGLIKVTTAAIVPSFMAEYLKKIDWVSESDCLFRFNLKYGE